MVQSLLLTWIKHIMGMTGTKLADEYAKLGTIDNSKYQFTMATKAELKKLIETKL